MSEVERAMTTGDWAWVCFIAFEVWAEATGHHTASQSFWHWFGRNNWTKLLGLALVALLVVHLLTPMLVRPPSPDISTLDCPDMEDL